MEWLLIVPWLCAVAFLCGYARGLDDGTGFASWGIGWDEGYAFGRKCAETVDDGEEE